MVKYKSGVVMQKELSVEQFVNKPIIEFMNCVYLYSNYEEIIRGKNEIGYRMDKNIIKYIKNIDKNISKFVKNEVYSLSELSITDCIIIAFVSDFQEIITVEDFFNKYDEISIEQLFDYFGRLFLSSNVQRSTEGWNSVNASLSKMKEYISNIKEVPKELAKVIVELYNFPEETRMRVKYCLQEFYLKGYKPYEEEILEKAKREREKYEELLKNDKNAFEEINFNKYDNGIDNWKEWNIYVSYFQHIGTTTLSDCRVKGSIGTISIGYDNINYFNSKNVVDNFDRFLKALGDTTRFKIIIKISEKPWYMQALSKELGISPSTIHHHLEILSDLDMVKTYKEDNKVLYKLNDKKIKQYFSMLEKKIIIK